MALLDTDQIAVWRNTEQKNYVASVTQLMARVPTPTADDLTEVLTAGNTSDNLDIIINNASASEVVKLSASGNNHFVATSVFDTQITVGATPKILLKSTGVISGVETNLLGDSNTGNALRIYEVGTTINNLDAGTGTATVTITNAGVATFAGALEALSIDGGIYAS